MKVKSTSIKDVLLVTPETFEDSRGYFFESFNENEFSSIIGRSFSSVQDNQSYSSLGTLRGIHFQSPPMSQAKIVRVLDGEIYDVAVDLRKDSSTYCKWVGEYLSSENKQQLYIPEGFGHAFVVTSKSATVLYKVNNYYSPRHEQSIKFDDPTLGIKWPDVPLNLSAKDSQADYIDSESSFF